MLNNLLNSEQRILGLDIGSTSLKMAEIRHNSDGSKELMTYGTYDHNINLEGFWEASKIEEFAKIIEIVRKNASFKTLKTVVALQAKNVFVTTMDFDTSWDKKMIQDEINRQARYFLPYPPDEMKVSWNVVPTSKEISSVTGKQRIVINALPNFVINNLTNLLNRCNLEGVAFENQTLSISRSILNNDKKSTILVDLGSNSTTYSIIIDGVLRNSYTSSVGLNKLDENIANSLGINIELAENFKKDISLVNLYDLPSEFTNHLTLIRSELINFYQQNVKIAQTPEQILITGGGSLTAGLLNFLTNSPQSLQVPIKEAKIAVDLKFDKFLQQSFSPLIPSFATSIGLALRK
jgi:type IV pilus assembly protein PilM